MSTSSEFWAMARKPRWIAALLAALAIAGGFAALGQWQLERSFEGGEITEEQSETVVSLDSIAVPQQPMTSDIIGQRVTIDASFVSGDYLVLSDRLNQAELGYWVVGHAVTESGASLAVAVGWAPTDDDARSAIKELASDTPDGALEGRYLQSESPEQSDFEAGARSALAVAELINLWSEPPAGVYAGYLVLADAPAGLDTIDSPPPVTEVSINLLNVFYAVEWVLFAGFAVFLWYRLVMDAVEAARESATVD